MDRSFLSLALQPNDSLLPRALHAELDCIAAANRAEEPVVSAMEKGVDAVIAAARRSHARESTVNELAYQLLFVDKKKRTR